MICITEEIERLDLKCALGAHYKFSVACTLEYVLKFHQASSEFGRISKKKGSQSNLKQTIFF